MLVPNGKRRLMVAQTAPSPTAGMAGEMDLSGVEAGNTQFSDQQGQGQGDPQAEAAAGAAQDPAGQMESEVQQQGAAQQSQGQEGDVSKTVFDFLVGLGYPPRRLQEFKSRFVSESGSANAGTTVTLVCPDQVYGQDMQIPRAKIKELVQMVEQRHGLSFQDYKRANQELTLSFMTADAAAQQSMQDNSVGDILDQVYGKPAGAGKGKGGKPPVRAQTMQEMLKQGSIFAQNNEKFAANDRNQTIQEMIKESKERQVHILMKVLGSK